LRAYLARSVVLAVALVFIGSGLAVADSVSFDLTSNNLNISGSVGTVTFTDTGTDQVTVSIMMNAGFSVKLQGGDIALNGPSGLMLSSVSGFTGTAGTVSLTGLSFMHLRTSQNVSQFGTFDFDYANISGTPGGIVSADTLTFVLTAPGLKANQFTGVGFHFCTASGGNCGPHTGFASSGPVTPVPEPGAMSLMGAGLIGLAGIVRRRIRG
jgi:PEP-CTERM motif